MKYKLLLLSLCFSLCSNAQVITHDAFDTNGPTGKNLFPQNEDGDITFSKIIEVNGNSEQIKDVVKSYIYTYASRHDIDIKDPIESELKLQYQLKYPVGKENVKIGGAWGNPFISFLRDASRVIFNCTIEIRNGKFKYTLSDFETNRRMIRGEAKNNGQSNTIHWQRVNSLAKERNRFIQKNDTTKRKNKEELYDYNSQIAYEEAQYKKEYASIIMFISGLEALNSTTAGIDADSDFESSTEATNQEDVNDREKQHNSNNEELDLTNYHGNLLAKGNFVYLPSKDSKDYELWGIREIAKQIQIDGYWTIVDSPQKAHFIVKYYVTTEGRDKAHMIICDREEKNGFEFTEEGSEWGRENKEVAKKLYFKSLYEITQKNKIPKDYKIFDIE